MDLQRGLKWLKENEQMLADASKQVWDTPEVGFQEEKSAAFLADILEQAGFDVERSYAEIPTAFRATFGKGKPVIGLLAEYDALPGMSQKVQTTQEPIEVGGAGHGCGHNLIGGTMLTVALSLKEAMDSEEDMTIVYYGSPAEELLVGKGFMARAGAFTELDLAITMHPWVSNYVAMSTMTALESGKFHFYGTTAHAAADPWNGRSALDAVELMDVAANYLREHVTDDVRIHYAITEGGIAPNIVPDKASVLYYVRAQYRSSVMDTFDRIEKCAEGAALMTGTRYELERKGGCYEVMANEVLSEVLNEALLAAEPPVYTQAELDFAEALNKTSPKYEAAAGQPGYEPISTGVKEMYRGPVGASSDVGDVSHIVPLVYIMAATQNSLAPNHSWHITACAGHSIGQKGMLYSGRAILGFVDRVLKDPSLIVKAKAEFDGNTRDNPYQCPITEEMTIPE
ncbi:MAG: amidohydrolase [Tissierellia bacterium]|nr:amidohydrolase [Tissierellia bacterium]